MSDEKEILKKIRKDWYAEGQTTKCIDGCYFPQNIKTPHQRFPVPSESLDIYKKSLLETLSAFHKYTEDNNILYSLHAGTLIGYYWNGGMIPWDDDIDIMVSYSDMLRIKDDLWKNGKPPKKVKRHNVGRSFRKLIRITDLYGEKYEIIPSYYPGYPENRLIKLRQVNLGAIRDPGGLDIGRCRVSSNGKITEGWKKNRICFGPTDDSLPEDYPVVTFAGIKTRVVVRELGEPYLDQVYDPSWRIMCHPKMKTGYKLNTP
jgi:hypothetical protein